MDASRENCRSDDAKKDGVTDPNIIKSPNAEMAAKFVIPDVSLTTFLFDSLKTNKEFLKGKTLVINVITEESIKFDEIEMLSKQFASALTRLGFKKGDVLYYVTYDSMYLFVVQLGVWLCGGAVRGCFQKDEVNTYERQMREVFSRFVLIEKETVDAVKSATKSLEWEVQFLSVGGEVDGATPIEEMIFKDDGSALPVNVNINPKVDVAYIPTTSGTTGIPKGVLHTHYNIILQLASTGLPADLQRETRSCQCTLMCFYNYGLLSFLHFYCSLMAGETYINIPKFDEKTLLDYIVKYKPDTLRFFPYLVNWFIHFPELHNYDLSCVKVFVTAGFVLQMSVLKELTQRLPHVRIYQSYGMTEVLTIATGDVWQCAEVEISQNCETLGGLKVRVIDNENHVSCGHLIAFVEAKEWDPQLDADGWFDTGGVGFFDNDDYLYIVDRLKSVFKYFSHHVFPTEIEGLINDHPAVSNSAVVAVPNVTTGNLARAYVVLKPQFQVTGEDIKEHVAKKAAFYKHLHGGVAFLDSLAKTAAGKIDKRYLLGRAKAELQSA